VSGWTTPLALAADRRRLALCVAAALALHGSGVVSRWLRWKPAPVEVIEPPPPLVPVSLDEPPPPLPPAAPPPPAEPPPPAPVVAPPTPVDAPAPRPEPRREPPKPVAARAPAPRPEPEVLPDRKAKLAEDASAFTGKPGAFHAKVCFVPKDLKSALLVDGCERVAAFSTNQINVSPRRFKRGFPGVEHRVEWFGLDYSGRFKVRAGGYYTFGLMSDDGAVLFIDGVQVLDNDGLHSPRLVKIGMPLSQGEHHFRLLYYQGPGRDLALQLFVKGYKTQEQLFGPEF
jgi:hypothetical protein